MGEDKRDDNSTASDMHNDSYSGQNNDKGNGIADTEHALTRGKR